MAKGSLDGRSALIIGGKLANGIGAAVARRMAAEGARVAVGDLDNAASHDSADMLQLECDVRNDASVASAIQSVISRFGKLDILVNNASIAAGSDPLVDLSFDRWDRIIEVNLKGVALAMKHALPHMIERKYGRIINTASQLAHKPAPGKAAYCAAKAGVVALTVSVAQEVADKGITVNCVCPGPTATQMWVNTDEKWKAWKAAQLPIGRVGTPDEVASAYVYLATDEASFMIGQSLSPNGGDVMW